MPLDNEKLKKVYATLKKGGYNHDYNSFVKGFSGNENYDNRKRVYDWLTENGAQVGKNYAEFMQKLYTPSPKQTQIQQPRVNRGSMVRAVTDPLNARGIGGVMQNINKVQEVVKKAEKEKANGYQPRFDGVTKRNTEAKIPTLADMKPMPAFEPAPHFDTEESVGADGKIVSKAKPKQIFDGSGQPKYVYQDSFTGKTYDPNDSDPHTQEMVKRGEDAASYVREAPMPKVAENDLNGLASDIDKRMLEIENGYNEKAREDAYGISGWDIARGDGALISGWKSSMDKSLAGDMEYQILSIARKSLSNAHEMIEEAEKSKREGSFKGFIKGAGRGFVNGVFDPETWDFGASSLKEAMGMEAVLHKFDNGQKLTKAEQTMLDAKAMEMAVNAFYGSDLGRGYKAGKVTAEAIPFMIEMAINPASGAGKSAASMLTRYALKRFGKKGLVKASKKAAEKAFVRAEERALAKGLSKSVAKAAGERAAARATKQTIKFQAAKTGARVLGDIVGASTMAATTGAMRTAADAVSRHSGDVKFDVNNKGHIVFAGHDKGDDWVTAVKKAFANTAIENFSELFGAYLASIGSFVGKAGEKLLSKIGLGKVTEMLGKLKASDISQAVKRLEGKVQFNGVIFGEYPEENFGGLMNALIVGDQTLDDAEGTGLFNIDNQIDTFLGVSLMGGVFSAARLGGGLVGGQGNLEARRAVRQAGVAALKDFKGKELIWDKIKTDVDNASNDQLKQVVKNIVTDGGLSDENKKAALQYVRSSMQLRGVDAIRPLTKEEAEADMHNVQEEAAHNRGLEADAQERKDIAIESADPNNAEAQQAWAAVEQRIDDDATRMADAFREKALQMQHNDGSFHTATLKEKDEHGEGKQVFIVSGHVQMTPDGTMIDREASDKTIVIFDPSTGERKMIDPSSDFGLSSVDKPTTSEELEASIERNRQGFIQAQLDEARGTIRLSVGQQFVLPDGNEAVVVALDESGEDITAMLADGTQVNIQRAELQQAHDEQALAEYLQRKGNEEPMMEDEATEQSEQGAQVVQIEGAPSSYEPDMELVVRNENGGESQAMVMGRVRYEGGEFIPDENGGIVEYFMDGEVRHEQIGKLNDRVVAHTDAAQVVEEETPPAEDVQAEEEAPLQEEKSVPEENDATLPDKEELAPAAEEDAKEDNAMPMRDNGEEDWEATTPERAHAYIFNEAGLSQSEGNEFVAAQKDAAQRALNKAKSAQAPRVGTSIRQYNEAKAKHQEKIENAQRVLDYWNAVQDIQVAIQHKEREQKEAEDAKAHEEAAAQMQAEFEARKAAEAERAEVGNENPMPEITEKWNNAEKIDGHSDEIVLPDGTALKGHYVLHESGASSPSHNAETWKMTEGFPMDVNDNSVNDRDYEHDKDAQAHTEEIARHYDQRALQSVPVVSRDGVVLSGNGRTMAGELAARDNTDRAYIDYLKAYAHKFGFTPEQVEAMEHPRVSFVPNEAMPYTAETFARFNQQEMKSQSKTEQAVKLGKTVSDDAFRAIVRTINGFDTLGDFYNDPKESVGAVYDLHNAGVIPQTQLAEMVDGIRGQERLSAVGREYLENMLIGKAFANEPDVLRMLTAEPAMRQTIITALGEIVDNIALGEDWALQGELADAVKLCFEARKDGAKYGDIVSAFARQGILFADPDQIQTKADFRNVTMLMLADALNDKRVTLLKTVLQLYNNEARLSASGQADVFAGGIQSREDILRNVINYIKENYGKSKEIEAARAEAMERRKAESLQEDGYSGTSIVGIQDEDEAEQTPALKEDEDPQGNVASSKEESPTDFTPSSRKDGEDVIEDIQAGDGYSIEPTTYTNKKGKTTPMHFVKFDRELSKEEIRAGKEIAKESRGWWDSKQGGFMMRSEEAAKALAESLSNEEAVQDAQPLSVEDMADVTDHALVQAVDDAIKVEKKEQPTVQYDYDREEEVYDKVLSGLRDALNNNVGSIPNIKAIEKQIRDLRRRIKTVENGLATTSADNVAQGFDALALLTGRVKAYEQFLSDLKKKMREAERDDALAAHGVKIGDKVLYNGNEATIYDADKRQVILDTGSAPVMYKATDWGNISVQDAESKPQEEEDKKPKSKWVDDEDAERFEELRKRLKKKLRGQLNIGVDPEILTIGIEMSYLVLKKGARKFKDFAEQLLGAVGEEVRPYLKAFYNGARDLPEMEDYAKELTPYDEVRTFDVKNFDKEGAKDIVDTAEHIVREQEAERDAKKVSNKLKEERNERRKESEQQIATNTTSTTSNLKGRYMSEADIKGAFKKTFVDKETGAELTVGKFTSPHKVAVKINGDVSIVEWRHLANILNNGKWQEKTSHDLHDSNIEDNVIVKSHDEVNGEKVGTQEENTSKESGKDKKDVSLQQPTSHIIGGLFDDDIRQKKNERNERNDGSRESHSSIGTRREELSSSDKVGTGASVQDPARDSQGQRRRLGISSTESGTRPQYDVNRKYSNEEINDIVSSVTEIRDGKVVITDNVSDDIRAIARQYVSGGIAKDGRGVLDEYYTDGEIVDAVASLIAPLLPKGRRLRVLEPSVGVGNFIAAVPKSSTSKVVTFEINETTARIAKILHPDIEVNVRSFETEFIDDEGNKKPVRSEYDVAIGNPPYGAHRGMYKGLGEESKIARYEDYFVKRSLDVLSDGGVLAMVLPSSWLDRQKQAKGYNVVRAYRLPSGAFAGTNIGTDIVVLRKKDDATPTDVSRYFDAHPERVLGVEKERKGRFGRQERYIDGDIDTALSAIQRDDAIDVAKELGLPHDTDTLNDVENAIEEAGSVDGGKSIVQAEEKEKRAEKGETPKKRSSKGVENGIKLTLKKGGEIVPASVHFQTTFSESEIEAFKDTYYDGTIENWKDHIEHVSYHNGSYLNDFYYAEGDIYARLDQLERDKDYIVNTHGQAQYEKQRSMLERVLPNPKGIDEISITPNTSFVHNLRIGGEHSLERMFLDFIHELPHEAFGGSSAWEVGGYVRNEQVYGNDKHHNQLVRDRRKKVGDALFKRFLKEELSESMRGIVLNAFNREYNGTYRPDYSQVPMFSQLRKEFHGRTLKLTNVQLAGVGRSTVKGVGVLAHEVGFGKTLSGVLAMQEAMTRGNARKPLIVVPNDNIMHQWIETIEEVVPEAVVNVLGNLGAKYDLTDFAVNDGEYTIVTYEGLKAMSFSDKTYGELANNFSYITDELEAHKSQRDIEKAKAKHQELAGKMKRGSKKNYNFEDFGFDYLTFDEVHNANHIVGKVKLDSSEYSDFRAQNQRPSDLGIKTWMAAQYIQEHNNGRNVLLLSATPFTNKPLEYYSILSLVANDMLKRKGFYKIDEFFKTFMEADNELEINAAGKPVRKTNVRRFRNNGLFQSLLGEYIDIKGEDDNPDLVRPDRHNKEYKLPQNELTQKAMDSVQDMLADSDTLLQGIGSARQVAFSPYSVFGIPNDYKMFVENSPKIDATMKLIKQNKKDFSDAGQIIYSEVCVDTFPLIKEYLVREIGYKDSEVRTITGATSNAERLKIQEAFNTGDVKVVIGSPAIKEGLNLQGNTTDMYILSLPWNFTQLRQIEGRGWRQGNRWKNIRINYMLTEDSADVFMLQRLQTKQGLYNEAMKKGVESVDVSDIDTTELKAALIKNPATRADIIVQEEFARLNDEKIRLESEASFVERKCKDYKELDERRKSLERLIAREKKDTDSFWVQSLTSSLEAVNIKIEQEREKLRKKGVDLESVDEKLSVINERIDAIKQTMSKENRDARMEQLTAQFTNEAESHANGATADDYIKERAKENAAGYYELRKTESEEESSKSEDVRFRQGEGAARELKEVNERFNRELAGLTEENADTKIFNLGSPSSILLSAGVEDKPMKLYGNKVIKKMKKHGFALEELQDLPKAVANPIAVFDNYQQEGNRTILTELRSQGKNIMVAVTLGKNGVDVDFNIVSSVFGKGSTNIVDWISKGYLAYVDKEKALNYLYFSERNISEAAENSELSSAANILKDFENPTIEGKNHTALSENILPTESLRDRKAMRNEAEQLAEKLHTPINVVEDANEITHPNKEIEARRRKAKGWYNVSTGEVVVVLANHKDAADVAATICHEVVAHKGLRELVGEAHYDEFLDEVYDHLSGDLKREIDDAAGRAFLDDINKSGDDARDYKRHRRIAVDELFGSLAEKPFEEFSESERSLWQQIKEFAKKLLDRFLDKLKLPKWFELGDNELRYILWRSKERLERGKEDPIDQARDIVKREELGLTNEPLNKVSVTARNFEELAEQNEWNPKPIRGEEMVDLYEIAPKVTTHDYYLGTKAGFKLVKSAENVWDAWEKLKQQDGFRYEHSPKSDSEYLVNDKTGEIYRISDHWGWVASCRWSIDDQAPSGFNIGKANIKDFERIKGNYVFTPEAQRREPGHETYLRAKENLERALKDDTYKFTAAARRLAEEKVRSHQSNAEFYEQNHESGDIVYRRNEFGKYIPYREMKHSREQWFEGYISDEEREIVERAQADGSYMKAPNGKPSNLNGKQWAQVRTKAFKKWFGDWEKAARIALTEIEKGKLLDQINDQAVDNGFMSTGAEPNPSVTIGKDTKLVPILQGNSSKVVDENGEPQVIRSVEEKKRKRYFLNIRHPLEVPEDVVVSEIADKAVKEGYDGVHTPKGYIPFTVNQYKSAQRNNGEFSTESDDVLYRDSGETRDIWLDQSMGLQERTTAAAARLANNHRDNKVFMQDAMRAIGANLTDLRKAMRLQKDFDRTTAKRVYDLARILMEMGYLRGLNQQEVSKLLSVMKNSIGKQNIDNDVQQLMDLMVNHQLKQSKNTLESLEHIKGSKVNAKGVEVQGALDAEGQAIMAAMKAAKDIVTPCAGKTEEDNGELTAWGQALEDVQERMGSEDNAIAENAALEYQGMMLAQQWFDEIKQRELEEASLRQELNHAQSTTPAEERKGEAYKEYIGNLKQAIQQNKIDRAQAYMNLVGRLTESLRESIEGAKAFKLREKARISAIQRDANLDMEGRPAGEHYVPDWKARAVNNALVSGVAAPLATMDQMLRLFGNKSANGEGYLYNRFERGFVDARQQEIKGYREKTAILDAKAAEIFGGKIKTWADLIRYVSGLPDKEVVFKNGGIDERFTLSQGNLMYIYMVNKMLDGRLKLSKMGLTSDVVEELTKEIDPRLIKLADWMQEDFLVQTRNEYNETHKRVFGASMAAIENYFPLKIRSNARIDKAEDLDNPTRNSGISTTTGSIIKRRRNSLPLDLLNADALNIILDHITEMEHWNAFVEYNRDLNTLRTYKRFRNGVENMTTIYGSGKKLWKHFNDLCQITTGSYIPPREDLDKDLVNLAKGVTAAKVSFRLFTALKQFLSFPAYFPEVKAVHMVKCLAHPKESWDWCMENLPIFNERWNSRLSGDPRLLKTNMDWKMWRTRTAEIAMRIGMTPNAFVDALTVCIGARAMYMTRKGQYLRDGYTEEVADKKAKQDAEILYNQTQQSSEGAFLSRMQVNRGWLSVLFSIFRNSSMAYTRQVYDAMRNLRRNLTPGGRKESIAFMTKQYMNEGFDKAKAEENAKRKFDRQIRKDILRVATFGYLLQFAWNLGAYLPYMLFGGDDDEKEAFWQDIFAHSYFGSLEGLTGGDVISQVLGSALAGNLNPSSMDKDMPLTSDLAVVVKEFAKGDKDAALSDMINLIVQSGIGVNPQSITDSVLAIMDACGDDPALANEATIFIARILQVPQSQIDKLYFDEVGLMGSGLSKYTPAQLAERYARYKVKRGHFSTPWAWDDDVNIGKAMTKANREIKARTNHMGLTNLNEAFVPYEEVYQKVDKQMEAYEAAKKTDYVKAANMMVEIQKDKSALDTYQKLKSMDSQLDKMAKRFLSAKSNGERQLYRKMIESYKPAMLKVLQAKGEAAQEKAMDDIGTLMEGFAEEQEKLYENQ